MHVLLVGLVLVQAIESKLGSVVSNRIGMKFGVVVPQGNTHRLTESDSGYDVIGWLILIRNIFVVKVYFVLYVYVCYPCGIHKPLPVC